MSEEQRCSVLFCSGHYETGDEQLILFEFPKDAPTRQKWIKAIHRIGFKPTEQSRVCGKHFDMSQLRLNADAADGCPAMQLVKGAVPRLQLSPLQMTESFNLYCGHFGSAWAGVALEKAMSEFFDSCSFFYNRK